jgi:serine/threonine protein kinase
MLRRRVAIKVITREIAQIPEASMRFLQEARAAGQLQSQYAVTILDYGMDDETQTPYMVMEVLNGESLAHRLEQRGFLDPMETARILGQVASAVGEAHQAGIVHRDLKPDNIFIVRRDEQDLAKVLDFGSPKSPGRARARQACTRAREFGSELSSI